ncbi:hypothetical protein CPB83DRAFT_864745 [Crepidotus variabilis]|uniref:Uncharacterized protein n=1 Tax=Crepidotus variabilis TaxID=179855 RepID=A0A9P6E4A7_9AGAR|nr:hypothetical protein CPB83DRAFT_864745 [Crepidotus variabilis]
MGNGRCFGHGHSRLLRPVTTVAFPVVMIIGLEATELLAPWFIIALNRIFSIHSMSPSL